MSDQPKDKDSGLLILCFCAGVAIGSVAMMLTIPNLELKKQGYVKAKDVADAFTPKDIWHTHTFTCDSTVATDKTGNDKFYAVPGIDAAIKRLDKMLAGK